MVDELWLMSYGWWASLMFYLGSTLINFLDYDRFNCSIHCNFVAQINKSQQLSWGPSFFWKFQFIKIEKYKQNLDS
jgi:hypothetical protein